MVMLIKRESYLKRLTNLIGNDDVKIITGVRRSGKTCLMKLLVEELKIRRINRDNIIYISFESSLYEDISSYKDLNKLVFDLTKNLTGRIYLS